MPQCAVAGCSNTHRKTKGGSIRYHRFPGDERTRAHWIRACGRHVQNCATARICSRHFTSECYERDVQNEVLGLPTRCRLRKGALPDLHLPAGSGRPREQQDVSKLKDSAIAVLLAVGLVPNRKSIAGGGGGMPEDLNKMHVMEDVKEGCDTQQQPSSPGHAEQGRTEEAQTQSDEEQPKSPTETSVKVQEDFDFHSFEVKQEDQPIVPKCDTSQKRKNVEPEETPPKKQKSELQQEFTLRNKILSDFTDCLDVTNEDQMQLQTEQILQDIQKLGDLAKEKEREWNNILTVKKMKEELLMRIQRQKQVYLLSNGLEISETDPEDRGNGESRSKQLMPKKRQELRHKMRSYEMNGHDARNNNNNGNSNNNSGSNKQRPVRDVQSIIADYRQRHPETVPRRGRRIRSNGHGGSGDGSSRISNTGIINFSNVALGSGSQVRQNLNSSIDSNSDIGMLLSAMDAANPDLSSSSNSDAQDNTSFKDILVHFAKMSQSDKQELLQNTMKPPPPYPEVTVHPVSTTTPPTNSLLHGILTKAQSNKTDNKTTFSPTLARLLTAPECSVASQNQYSPGNKASKVSLSDILSTNKEDEEAEDSVDRLVIDESGEIVDRADTNSDNGDEVPQCQGCNQKAAQFVCAGCGNQWYCSRDCQVSAWDEHSEVCSG
ncbi:PREDICTED: putative uncharacterized protein DDB_G0274435 isoform X2 [Nicrophorus vespilloides]|uniref:THAP-type domain-containing protein n=1 Tax=Nicrophorus vespilloides TaxID=110193 RepID=A0ABM1M9C5_NICVS|nr:PREDICTED: putative uncharacterized protein DDB_G0274435 isoform X2 [Nicrophorus vespilloides]